MTREVWKYWYRQMRIARREAAKAVTDMMVYGSGMVKISVEGCAHVPAHVWMKTSISFEESTPESESEKHG
jgi:hypothetical protein